MVTGTLPEGTVSVGDALLLDGSEVRVRGIECLGVTVTEARGVSRVALNLAGRLPTGLGRGSVLLSPGWPRTDSVDVRLTGGSRRRRNGPCCTSERRPSQCTARPLDGSDGQAHAREPAAAAGGRPRTPARSREP